MSFNASAWDRVLAAERQGTAESFLVVLLGLLLVTALLGHGFGAHHQSLRKASSRPSHTDTPSVSSPHGSS